MAFPHLDILPPAQRRLWDELGAIPAEFTLYGGTALALRLGHRQSVDFDFFSNTALDIDRLQQQNTLMKSAQVLQAEPNTLTVQIDRGGAVKLSFFGGLGLGCVAPASITDPPGLRIAALEDLAATKFKVLPQRAESKDYLDIHALLQEGVSIDQMASWAALVFGPQFNPYPSVKALTFYEDGDLAALPPEVKHALRGAAQRFGA